MPAKMPNTPQARFWIASAKAKVLARPALRLGDGLQPQAKAVADAHGQRDDDGAAGQNLERWRVGARMVAAEDIRRL